ncbi:hypothetical protein ACS5PU_04890 [Pedobacter sp. GSP4]|uniref:hypothetical protein n=1 Tax=Pedobacter sp. GSP4 TaxID=3453716 RepID=UPI003EE904A0
MKNLKATISIPASYQLVNKERLDRVLPEKQDEGFKNELLNQSLTKPKLIFLIDTLKPNRYMMIQDQVPYTKIDTLTLYLLIDDERKKSSSTPEVNNSTFFVGSRMDSIKNFRFIESKHKRRSGNQTRIGYTFLISSDKNTTGISFFGNEEQNARAYVKTVKKLSN